MERAVVVGASIAGSLCAAVLSRHAGEVTIIDRDDVSSSTGSRRAVPQGRHGHGLYPTGLEVMERILPGVTEQLIAGGASPGDPGWDVGWWQFGARRAPVRTGHQGVLCSRPFLEESLRARAMALPNVQLVTASVQGLTMTGHAVDGVVVNGADGLDGERLSADLVVDCSGRLSHLGSWLSALGYEAPPLQEVTVDIGYASRYLRRHDDRLGDGTAGLLSLPEMPARPRAAIVLPDEQGRWLVTVVGVGSDRPRTEPEDFAQRVAGEPVPPLMELLSNSDPLTEVVAHRFPKSIRRDFDRLKRFPLNLFAAGDSVASFNPVYGQGMTCAARHADALDNHLAHGAKGDSSAYFRRVRKTTNAAWTLSVTEDFRLTTTHGRRPRGASFVHWFGDRYSRGCLVDPELHRRFLDVASMRAAPPAMMTPTSLARVARHRKANPVPHVPSKTSPSRRTWDDGGDGPPLR